jgi:hypothetical protein
MADPITIVVIVSGILTALSAFLGGIHYKFKMKCCCCQSDCIENETEKDIKRIKRIEKVSSIKSI